MPKDQKRRELQNMKLKRPPYSYDPMRGSILDILNVQAGPLAELPRTPWDQIAGDIRRRGKSDDEIAANLRAAEGLYNFASEYSLVGQHHEFYPLALGLTEKVTYWSPVVLAIEAKPVVPFLDPRRTKKLTRDARRFVFSVMHERIRVADPDFADVRLAIFQFENSLIGPRAPKPYYDDEIARWDFDSLDAMVRETYEIWAEVLQERDMEARRRGGSGPLI
jgi:hypothetical protein